MPVTTAKEIRGFTTKERKERLLELKSELMHERGVAAMGGSPPSPGKIRRLRMNIAKILTIMHEQGEQ
ncbi:MAG: 50S ribosomal protein L29 [Candidatus Thermoplasmatota archaeon]|nr:50S ribosomal protein L29 [Candidatus Thermoplasmatota archaeon]